MPFPSLFRMFVKEMFHLHGERTVLAGCVEGGEKVIIKPGPCYLFINGMRTGTIQIEPEMMFARVNPLERRLRAVSTRDKVALTKEMIANQECILEGSMNYYGHRHLLGIDSPPADYVADDMTLGPRLPEGWDGDSWIRVGGGGYFLRAWNKANAQCAVGIGMRYEEARTALLEEIAHGGKRVVVTVQES